MWAYLQLPQKTLIIYVYVQSTCTGSILQKHENICSEERDTHKMNNSVTDSVLVFSNKKPKY